MSENKNTHPYDEIINLPHHVSEYHPRMSMAERAAMFMPFRALTGYEDAVQETARLTDSKVELTEEVQSRLNDQLQLLSGMGGGIEASFTYFRPDQKKSGGAYITTSGRIKRLDDIQQAAILTDGTKIPMEDILSIQCGTLEYVEPDRYDSPDGEGDIF